MSTINTGGTKAYQATAAAIAEAVRVKLDSSGLISAAAANEAAIGVTLGPCAASGYITVRLFSASGTFFVTASGAITRGARIYPAASGKVAAAGTTPLNLVAGEAATADGDIIEAIPCWIGA